MSLSAKLHLRLNKFYDKLQGYCVHQLTLKSRTGMFEDRDILLITTSLLKC